MIIEAYVTLPAQSGRARLAAGTWRTWSIAAGEYRFSDLVDELEDQVSSAHADLAQFRATVDSDGIVRVYVATGTSVEVEWPSGLYLAEVLGYTAATTTATTGGARAPLPPTHRFTSSWEAITDPDEIVGVTSELRADASTEVLVHAPPYRQGTIEIEVAGWHRSGVVDEYLRLELLWEHAVLEGAKVRYYPDTSVTTAWARTNPSGYREGVAVPAKWAPRPVNARILGRYRQTLTVRWV